MADKNTENCTHDCSTCSSDCGSNAGPQKAPLNPYASVDKVFAVLGSKGGTGKSAVAALLASQLQNSGTQCAILDADLTGPTIPAAFGLKGRIYADERGMFPVESDTGVQIASVNSLIPRATDPVLARGNIVENTLKKFWSDILWEDVRAMFIDMPSGTGEIPITVLQHLPIDGLIVVTTPQEIATMLAHKTLKMAKALNIPVVALIENMATYKCPDCGNEHHIFGSSKVKALAKEFDINYTAQIPFDADIIECMDNGTIDTCDVPIMFNIAARIEELL
ncbi:MAG: P-loop NTPase [Oscillospiraceae bacterium]|nr:P-loop NTPase [Oscillospiraceae bacterium]